MRGKLDLAVERILNTLDREKKIVLAWSGGKDWRSIDSYSEIRADIRRYYPLLDFTKEDIWSLTYRFNILYNPLCDLGYTSIGCKPCTKLPTSSDERSGRIQDPEVMKTPRNLGYF